MSRANQRCACGSGRKFKNCCGRPPAAAAPAATRPAQVKVRDPKLGLPGSHQTFLAHFVNSKAPTPPHHGKGPFTVTVVLAMGDAAQGDGRTIDLRSDQGGDSYLEVPPGRDVNAAVMDLVVAEPADGDAVPAGTPPAPPREHHMEGFANAHGRLARLVVAHVPAEDQGAARVRVLSALRPVLAHWSFMLDRPMRIGRVVVQCETTKDIWTVARAPFTPTRNAPPLAGGVPPGLALAFEYYAEALGASSPTFEYLCYYKAAEALRRYRDGIQKELRSRGQLSLTFDRFLADAPPELWGPDVGRLAPRTFKDVLDHELQDARNAVAHAFLEDDDPDVGPEDIEVVAELARRWGIVARYVVRAWAEEILVRMAAEEAGLVAVATPPTSASSTGSSAPPSAPTPAPPPQRVEP